MKLWDPKVEEKGVGTRRVAMPTAHLKQQPLGRGPGQ